MVYLKYLEGAVSKEVAPANITSSMSGIYIYSDAALLNKVPLDVSAAADIQTQKVIADYKESIAFGTKVKDIEGVERVIPMTTKDFGLVMSAAIASNTCRIQLFEDADRSENELREVFELGDVMIVDGKKMICTKPGWGGHPDDIKKKRGKKGLMSMINGTSEWSEFVQVLATTTGIAYFGWNEVREASTKIMINNAVLADKLNSALEKISQAASKPGATPDDVFAAVWQSKEPIRASQFVS